MINVFWICIDNESLGNNYFFSSIFRFNKEPENSENIDNNLSSNCRGNCRRNEESDDDLDFDLDLDDTED